MRKTLVSIAWLAFIASPSLIGFLLLEAITPRPAVFQTYDYVSNVELSPDGKTLSAAHHDCEVTLFDTATRQPRVTLQGHNKYVNKVAYSHDSRKVATASIDHTIKIWDTTTGEEQRTLRGHQERVGSVVFTPDDTSLVSAGGDNSIRLWDVRSGENTATLHTECVCELALSPDGRVLASRDSESVKLWDMTTQKERATFSESSCSGLVFSPDSRTLAAAGGQAECLRLWDVETGDQRVFANPVSSVNTFFGGDRDHVRFSRDGTRLILCRRATNCAESGSSDYIDMVRVDLWDVATGKLTDALGSGPNQFFPPSVHLRYWLRETSEPYVFSTVVTPEGKLMTLGREGTKIEVREIDFRMSLYYRIVTLLVVVSTITIARWAASCWLKAGFCWHLRCLVSLMGIPALMFMGWYMSVFWVEAWSENTMPTESILFTLDFWLGFLALLMVALTIARAAWRMIRYRTGLPDVREPELLIDADPR